MGAPYIPTKASEISVTAAGTISSTSVQAALQELDGDIQGLGGGGGGGTSSNWVSIKDYGAACDGQVIVDGAITAGSNTLSSVKGLFVAGDVGKTIVISEAGAGGTDLFTTISAYNSATSIAIYNNALTTVSGASVCWGTDDTSSIQAGIIDVFNRQLGTLCFPNAVTLTTGVLNLQYQNVKLKGMGIGPYIGYYVGYPVQRLAPIILITNMTSTFLTISKSAIEDLYFVYPLQRSYASPPPKAYPPTISWSSYDYTGTRVGGYGMTFRRCTVAGAYDLFACLNEKGLGSALISEIWTDTQNIVFNMDNIVDVVFFDKIHVNDVFTSIGGSPNNMAPWRMGNVTSWFFKIARADNIIISNVFTYMRYGGFWFVTGTGVSPGGGYGQATNVSLDTVAYGIKADGMINSAQIGWDIHGLYSYATISNATVAAGNVSRITINGGAKWGSSGGFTDNTTNGKGLLVRDVKGWNPRGNAVGTPALPSSGTTLYNTKGVNCRVFISGGTVTQITIDSIDTLLTSGVFELYPGENIKLTYSSAPTWQWMGL